MKTKALDSLHQPAGELVKFALPENLYLVETYLAEWLHCHTLALNGKIHERKVRLYSEVRGRI